MLYYFLYKILYEIKMILISIKYKILYAIGFILIKCRCSRDTVLLVFSVLLGKDSQPVILLKKSFYE